MNTTYYLNNVMGNVFKTQISPALPTDYWLGLSLTTPNIAGGSVLEPTPSGSGYVRVKLTGNLSVPVNGTVTNNGAISFNESLTSWGTVKSYVIYDSQTGGNLLMFGDLTIQRTVEQGTVITIKAGELVITLENPTT